MRSYVTSYNALFTQRIAGAPTIERVEIPLIQRDYAQGREGAAVSRIRSSFLDVLHAAVTKGERISLDFIYGDVESGTLRPLDGQQRLTTLFLLHWYLAVRADRLGQEAGWKNFTYATRASARLFCERLVQCQPPLGLTQLSLWIEDQAWYLHTWRHDPTIQSMLVMLDAMHERFRGDDCLAAWVRLIDAEAPAISFHLLPIGKMGSGEDLYIKMNSRGKPLTPFENFKARFEQLLEVACPSRVEEFALKVDGAWADLLWPYCGSDHIVDDEFLRYFHFITEVCEWRESRLASGDLFSRAEQVYGPSNSKAAANLDFLFQALDTWVDDDVAAAFASWFTAASAVSSSADASKVVLFGALTDAESNLFSACCQNYVDSRGRNRAFSWAHTLLLYAVLLHRFHKTAEFARRLRILRNLIEASSNELRLERMPALLADVARLIEQGTLNGVTAFNQAQVADERLKLSMLAKNPELEQALFLLEDHPILRGCLAAFELDPAVFEARANAFHKLFADTSCLSSLTGALLAAGDYSRPLNPRASQFGSASNVAPWRDLLTGAGRSHLKATRTVLGRVLDAVSHATGGLQAALAAFQKQWLDSTIDSQGLDWRWYFVKYREMREGRSGIYFSPNGVLGYSVCMLNKSQMNSYYRDPYLLAIYRQSGVEAAAVEDPWFTGYETQPRWMRLLKSGTEIRCENSGLVLRAPAAAMHQGPFSQVCKAHGVGEDFVLRVPQVETGGRQLDSRDRVQLGAALLRDLVMAGL